MLFDLRGRRRRRTVQIIYAFLAFLLVASVALIGPGGETLFGGDSVVRDDSAERLERAESRATTNPQDAAAWAEVLRLRFQSATAGEGYDQTTGSFTDDGKRQLREVEQAWSRYLAAKPAKIDANVALLAVQAFGPAGLGENDKAVTAMERVIEARPDEVGLYVQYAQLAYAAGQARKADLAADRAVELAPKEQKKGLRETLDAAKTGGAAAGGTTTVG